jgi:uncharacterized lipoprotein YmbA
MKTYLKTPIRQLALLAACAAPSPQDRAYTADQNSNTVSVSNPDHKTLLVIPTPPPR